MIILVETKISSCSTTIDIVLSRDEVRADAVRASPLARDGERVLVLIGIRLDISSPGSERRSEQTLKEHYLWLKTEKELLCLSMYDSTSRERDHE